MPKLQEPITLRRIERALDRLAIIMTDDPDLGRKALPIFERLEREAAALRAEEEAWAAIRERAKRAKEKKRG